MRAESRKEWSKNNVSNILRVGIILLFLGLAILAITLNRYELVIAHYEPWLWLTVALVSVGPELAGIVIGVVTIDYLNERRQDEQLKEQLIIQMSSRHNDVTDLAIRALKARGWLHDGSLSRVSLSGANLSGADLRRANLSRMGLLGVNLSQADLEGADLSWVVASWAMETELYGTVYTTNFSGAKLALANLKEACLIQADLSSAYLQAANLSGANLSKADLSGANLGGANLSRADLSGADLSGANLSWANLGGANLGGADLRGTEHWSIEQLEQVNTLEGATMPDGVQLRAWSIEGPTFEEWKAQYLANQEA